MENGSQTLMTTPDPISEIAKYERLYTEDPTYRMGPGRKEAVRALLAQAAGQCISILDIGTGRGETLLLAEELGYADIVGTDAAEAVCWGANGDIGYEVLCCMAWEVPFADRTFDLVTCFDVLEHLPPDKTFATLQELGRLARRRLLLSVCAKPDVRDGVDLHINLRPYIEWHGLIERSLGTFFAVERAGPAGTGEAWTLLRRGVE